MRNVLAGLPVGVSVQAETWGLYGFAAAQFQRNQYVE